MNKVYIEPYSTEVKRRLEEPEEFFKHVVGPGWQKLCLLTVEKLFFLGWNGSLSQVKEKFGGLRFYFNNSIQGLAGEIAQDVVDQAEDMSLQTCEECGGNGRQRGGGWVKTLCMKHAVEQKRPIMRWEKSLCVEKGYLTLEEAKTYLIVTID